MQPIEPYVAVCIQNEVVPCTRREEIISNLERCVSLMEHGAMRFSRSFGEPVRLITFPEFFLQDWRGVTWPWWDHEVDPLEVCITLPGEETERLGRTARKLGVYIAAHALVLDPHFPGYFFNAGFILDPAGELIYIRHKAEHAGNLMYASPHDVLDQYLEAYAVGRTPSEALFPVVETDIGNLGMCMCFEMRVPELHRQLAANGAEVIIRPTAEMDAFMHEPRKLGQVLDRARAIENVAYYVVPHLGPSRGAPWAADEWAGGSTIVSYDGTVVAEAHTTGETQIAAVIDVDRLRRARQRGSGSMAKSMPIGDGRRGLPLFRPELYDYLDRPGYPPNTWRERPQTRDEKRALIETVGEDEVLR